MALDDGPALGSPITTLAPEQKPILFTLHHHNRGCTDAFIGYDGNAVGDGVPVRPAASEFKAQLPTAGDVIDWQRPTPAWMPYSSTERSTPARVAAGRGGIL